MSRVRSQSNLRRALEVIDNSATRHVRKRANELSGIAKDLHRTAPRGGKNVNRFGERRSAPGEVPAMETGALFAAIDQGVNVTKKQATVVVNWKVLEFGYSVGLRSRLTDRRTLGARAMLPRPLGDIALARFKARVK